MSRLFYNTCDPLSPFLWNFLSFNIPLKRMLTLLIYRSHLHRKTTLLCIPPRCPLRPTPNLAGSASPTHPYAFMARRWPLSLCLSFSASPYLFSPLSQFHHSLHIKHLSTIPKEARCAFIPLSCSHAGDSVLFISIAPSIGANCSVLVCVLPCVIGTAPPQTQTSACTSLLTCKSVWIIADAAPHGGHRRR